MDVTEKGNGWGIVKRRVGKRGRMSQREKVVVEIETDRAVVYC
jgi:hypothetical protein